MRSLQPRFARHLMGFPQTDFGSLVQALYGIEEGISRGLWADSFPSDFKGKKPGAGPKSLDIGTIVAPFRPIGPTYLHLASPPPRSARQCTQLEMPLSRAFQRLVEGGLIAPLPPRPPPRPTPPRFRKDLHCAYHQRAGHDTDRRPVVTIDPLHAHDTRAIPPPPGGVHLIEFSRYEIFMMGWDGEAPQPISLYTDLDFSGYIHGQQTLRPFRLILDEIPGQTSFSPVYLQHVPPLTPFILFPEGYGPIHRDVQIVMRSGRIAQPPHVDRLFVGTDSRKEVRREDDEILRQLRTTQARISIWSLLASSNTHRDALIRALSHDYYSKVLFDSLGVDHVRPLCIDIACSGRRVPFVLLDNGSALNVCPLVTAIAFEFSPSNFGSSTQTVRAYDGTQRSLWKQLGVGFLSMVEYPEWLANVIHVPKKDGKVRVSYLSSSEEEPAYYLG
ncbi:hypothetical protein AAG906_001688 [Vitis piasezkii]